MVFSHIAGQFRPFFGTFSSLRKRICHGLEMRRRVYKWKALVFWICVCARWTFLDRLGLRGKMFLEENYILSDAPSISDRYSCRANTYYPLINSRGSGLFSETGSDFLAFQDTNHEVFPNNYSSQSHAYFSWIQPLKTHLSHIYILSTKEDWFTISANRAISLFSDKARLFWEFVFGKFSGSGKILCWDGPDISISAYRRTLSGVWA